MAGSLQLDFGNLPLVEAAVRASFDSSVELKFSTINEVQHSLGASFPNVTEPKQYEVAPGVSEGLQLGPGHINGVVFEGNPHGLRCTLQRRVAVVRWLKQYMGKAPDYPRFPTLQAALWNVIEAVKSANAIDALPIVVVNMSYVNFIRVTDFSTVLTKYFSPLVHVKATDGADEIRKVELAWREGNIDLRFRLEKISGPVGEETIDGCQLTSVAGMHVSATDGDAGKSLEGVHSRLLTFFHQVISEEAKKEWQLKEISNG